MAGFSLSFFLLYFKANLMPGRSKRLDPDRRADHHAADVRSKFSHRIYPTSIDGEFADLPHSIGFRPPHIHHLRLASLAR